MIHLYRRESLKSEYCFNIETSIPLTSGELMRLKRILAHGFIAETVSEKSNLNREREVIEVGPRMNFATAFHTNVSQICNDTLLQKVARIERSRRVVSENVPRFDRMTECVYGEQLKSFDSGIVPEPVKLIQLVEKGQVSIPRNTELLIGKLSGKIFNKI